MTTRLRARFVIGHDGRDHVVYENGELVYQDDRVLFVGHGYPGPVDHTCDYGDALIGPGFVDLDALADIDHGIVDTFQPAELAKGLTWSEAYFRERRRDVLARGGGVPAPLRAGAAAAERHHDRRPDRGRDPQGVGRDLRPVG